MLASRCSLLLACLTVLALGAAGCSDAPGSSASGSFPSGEVLYPTSGDPGTAEWQPVPPESVAAECGLDPALLAEADAQLGVPWAVVRYGRLCHEFYPDGAQQADEMTEIFSTTKTLGAVVTGVAVWQSQDLPRTGRKTGPLTAEDRVDHWLDEFSFNPDAHIAHVLAMVAHNEDLSFGEKLFAYDIDGRVQINRLSDVINTVVAQDPERLGANIEELTQRFLFGPLGMRHSRWSNGAPDKNFAYSWSSTVRDMARLGLLLLHGGLWSGERILGEDWVYAMTHPSFEDASKGYGYLTWVNSLYNGVDRNFECAPLAVNAAFPHGLSEAADCGYEDPTLCEQEYDVGAWNAAGLFGQYIVGHRALDLVLVAKELDPVGGPDDLWRIFRPALIALDAEFAGDEEAFCAAYEKGAYAPDLR